MMAVSWVSLIVCLPVYLYISHSALGTVLIGDEKTDAQNVREIALNVDVHALQEQAAFLVREGHAKSKLSMFLCNLALIGLFVAMACSTVVILQIRKLKKHTNSAQAIPTACPITLLQFETKRSMNDASSLNSGVLPGAEQK